MSRTRELYTSGGRGAGQTSRCTSLVSKATGYPTAVYLSRPIGVTRYYCAPGTKCTHSQKWQNLGRVIRERKGISNWIGTFSRRL